MRCKTRGPIRPCNFAAAWCLRSTSARHLAPWLFLAGFFFQIVGLVWAAVVFFAGAVAFHLVTLPVELDASRRARAMLRTNGMVTTQEFSATEAVLNAAAFTYLAALVQATAQLLYFAFHAIGMGGDD